ncbi:flagellar hook-associated protein FlgK [Paracoccus ravus]|uniref:flagellar hook-associated protein FlgK n=1 Tax=Paracoccus ravus TaxID=2447760 RepID=UPI00106EF5E5|nr:flagellar hook-associated protein FlgK [Paracoccus ravus]
MSLSSAIGAAKSGLTTTSIQAELVARNIANASTSGYTRKSANLMTTAGGGVYVATIDRQVDSMLNRLDRANISKLAALETVADGMKAYTDFLGQPDDETSPVASLASLKEALITLSGGVSDRSAQLAVISAARNMASNLNSLSDTLSSIGGEVEMNIRYDVAELNTALYDIAALNKKITAGGAGSDLVSQYQDQMDQLLQTVAGYVDIQTVTDNQGIVTVLTGGGVELVSASSVHDVTYDPGTGRLRAGQNDMTPGNSSRSFTAGSLAGLFELRNGTLPSWNGELQGIKDALVDGFAQAAPLGNDAGLFIEAAGKLAVNPAVDPSAGGDAGLLQSGGGDLAPGDGSIVNAMLGVFSTPQGGSASLTEMVATIVAGQQQLRADKDAAVTLTSTTAATISASRENLQGVNVDDELQRLLLVEQSYAANAKVLSSVTEMLDSLLQAV